MAITPQENRAAFYQQVVPLSNVEHANLSIRASESLQFAAGHHAIPLTAEEFTRAQHHFPIVFGSDDSMIPLALMGLNPGVNAFIDDNGKPIGQYYVPAYIRRYPYMGARLNPEATQLSLCVDLSSETIGEFDDGEPLFDSDGKPTEATRTAMDFCEKFEQASARTRDFLAAIRDKDLLKVGEITLAGHGLSDEPFTYKGFRIIDEDKLRALDGETLVEWSQRGFLAPMYAQLASLHQMTAVFTRQVEQGKLPGFSAEGREGESASASSVH